MATTMVLLAVPQAKEPMVEPTTDSPNQPSTNQSSMVLELAMLHLRCPILILLLHLLGFLLFYLSLFLTLAPILFPN
jgi:hypothetical protein